MYVSAVFTEKNREVRIKATTWFLSKDASFFEEKIIWTDKQYFVLNQGTKKSIHKVYMGTI